MLGKEVESVNYLIAGMAAGIVCIAVAELVLT